ncbi:MAG: DUF6600 domain-containing protein [Thermoanaerobaculia bacterium]
MKPTRILFLSLILLGTAAGTGFAATSVSAGIHIGPSGHASVDVGFFYDDLASYGNWVERPNYGWAWRPHAVASSWRPYQAGHWVWTDEGWAWISDEPYGWATYHYGRWYDDPDYGWEWIPGDEWAPAWVAWQEGDDYIGWAPLPPSVDYRPGVELSVSLGPEAYVFVQERQFLAPRLANYFVPRADCVRIYHSTRNITRYNVVGNRVFNQGVQVDRLQRVVGRPVPRYQIADLNADQRHQGARVAQNRVALFRPQVDKVKVAPPPSRPVAKRAVMTGAAAAAIVAAHHANQARQAQVAGNAPPAAARPQTKEERRQIAQAPPQHGRNAPEAQPVPQAKRPPAVQQQQAAQQQEARQQKNQQRQAERQAAQQQAEEQKAQRQAAQQQRAEQRQAQRQEAQQPRQQRPPERQAQRQPPPQPKDQGKPQGKPGKPQDDKQKPPPQ